MSGPVRILLADDHMFVCELLRVRLQDEHELTVVGSVGDTGQAMAEIRRLQPDLAVLDIDMPGQSVFGVAAALRPELPQLRIVFLSAFVSDWYVQQALDLGAAGYICKTEPLDVIVAAVRDVARGGTFYSPEVRERIVVDHDGIVLATPVQSRLARLTPREREVLDAVARGLAKKNIADLLCISVKTVEQHCAHLMEKLEIHDRVELARYAIREGLVNP